MTGKFERLPIAEKDTLFWSTLSATGKGVQSDRLCTTVDAPLMFGKSQQRKTTHVVAKHG